ncbi:MAG: type IV pilin-like G/H family protein [Gloeomargarita sp. HHBFW_bins_205]
MVRSGLGRYWLIRLEKSAAQGGFTLIELLVVVVIIGILAAIALPSLLAQTSKSKQAEAKMTLNAWIKGQQLYRYEYGQFFPFYELGLGLSGNSKHFNYVGDGGQEEVFENYARLMAYSKDPTLKRYAAGIERDMLVVPLPDGWNDYRVHDAPVLCESHTAGSGLADPPLVNGDRDGIWPACPSGYTNLLTSATSAP